MFSQKETGMPQYTAKIKITTTMLCSQLIAVTDKHAYARANRVCTPTVRGSPSVVRDNACPFIHAHACPGQCILSRAAPPDGARVDNANDTAIHMRYNCRLNTQHY